MTTATPNATRFVTYTFTEDWPELVVAINEFEATLRLHGRPVAADMLLRAYIDMREALLALGRDMAVRATELLKESEKKTQVRPDTHGGGGNRLADSLVAEAIDQQLMPGAVGVADLDVLNSLTPWWLTNETGSSARVGGRLFGYFHGPGDAQPPDASQFREHPLFQAGSTGDPLSGVGIIHNPIPARKFIAKAAPIIEAEWRAGFEGIKRTFDAALSRVGATLR